MHLRPVLHAPQAQCPCLPPSPTVNQYRSVQATAGYLTLGDTLADVIAFSGVPDQIEVFILDNPAVITFTDEQNRTEREIRLETGVFYEPGLRSRKVRARNATAGLNARLQVVGKWA